MQYGTTISAPLGGNINRRLAATLDPNTGAATLAGVGAKAVGIFTEDVTQASGDLAGIQVEGIAPCIYGSAAHYLDDLTPDAQARLIPAAGATGTHVWCVGFATYPGQQAGDLGSVLVSPHLVIMP